MIINTVPVMKEGKPVGIRGVVIDITEHKRVEEQVRLQAMVLDQIQDLVTVTDLYGNITYVNETELVSLGYPKQDLIGKNVSFLGEDANKGADRRRSSRKRWPTVSGGARWSIMM